MNRAEFHDFFKNSGPIILPVIHVISKTQTAVNINKLIAADIKGCFLINHDFDMETFLPIIRSICTDYPDFWIGINFLAVTGLVAFPILASLKNEGCRIDAYWGDDARIDERQPHQAEAEAISKLDTNVVGRGFILEVPLSRNSVPLIPKITMYQLCWRPIIWMLLPHQALQQATQPKLAKSRHSDLHYPTHLSHLLQALPHTMRWITKWWIVSWLRRG